MSYKAILNLVPLAQSTALVGENVKMISKKNKSSKDLIGLGVKNIIGTTLIKEQANLIGSL